MSALEASWPNPPPAGSDLNIPLAALRSVTKRYGQVAALRSFSMSLDRGEVVALLGPNGAGKTTAIRLLLGLLSPDEGSAQILGRDPRQSAVRTTLGTMLQVGRAPEMLRVREQVELFRSYYFRPLSTAETLQRAGLQGLEERMFGQLSAGQKQRALFALAICGNPDLLVLDEPTVGMDVTSRIHFWEQMRSLVAAGKSILLTTHYLEEADTLASRIIVIDKGRLIREGTPTQIKHGIAGRRIRCITRLERSFLRSLPSVREVRPDRDGIVIFAEQPEAVVRTMLLEDQTLRDLEISAVTLEDAVLALTGDPRPAGPGAIRDEGAP